MIKYFLHSMINQNYTLKFQEIVGGVIARELGKFLINHKRGQDAL